MLLVVKILFSIFFYLLLVSGFILNVNAQDLSLHKPQTVIKYPVNGSSPFPLLTTEQLSKVTEALTLAKELTKDCDCDKALQSYGINSLAEILILEPNVNIFDGRKSTLGLPWLINGERETVNSYFVKNQDWLWAGVIQSAFTGKGNILFLNSYFFNPNKNVTVAIQQRAIILIHESVHQYANKNDKYFGGSQRLTKLIINACLPNLKM